METRFRALRIMGTLYKVLGGIIGAITILSAVAICLSSVLGSAVMGSFLRDIGGGDGIGSFFAGALGGVLVGLITLIYGGTMAITLYAMGEGVYLLLGIEENTRAAAQKLGMQ
ncbi:MAG: hypothetical protein PVI78_11045 [Anaerolineales bacterium]|jgi:hypothetical protein